MIVSLARETWEAPATHDGSDFVVDTLEAGGIVHFPHLAFPLKIVERRFLSAEWSDGNAKNISFDASSDRIRGARGKAADLDALTDVVRRFAACARALIAAICPGYREHAVIARTSFRPLESSTRITSVTKDDRLLHVDAFPSRPTGGARILRVFCNVNPDEPRVWRVGESFEGVARRYLPSIKPQLPGSARTLALLRITKSLRTPYDHIMLELHDRMKRDARYQQTASHKEIAFAPGSSWMCFSDQVSHAAIRGRYLMEQTLQLPVDAMRNPERSPLRVLERLTGRALVAILVCILRTLTL